MLLHVFLFSLVARLSRQNHQFSDDILAAQVDARVGFAVAFSLCTAYGFRERNVGGEFVEDKIERATQHSFNLQDFVSRVAQVVDGADNGQSGTDVGFVSELHSPHYGSLFQSQVFVVW